MAEVEYTPDYVKELAGRLELDLFKNPELLIWDLDFLENLITYLPMTKGAYSASPWLDNRVQRACDYVIKDDLFRLVKLYETKKLERVPVNFILHTSHCGSTLLSRCLDEFSEVFVLREPPALTSLSRLKLKLALKEHTLNLSYDRIFNAIMAMHERRWSKTDKLVIKLNSLCHNLLDDFALNPQNRFLILIGSALDFLVSMYSGKAQHYLSTYWQNLFWDLKQALGGKNIKLTDDLAVGDKLGLMWLARVVFYMRFMHLNPSVKFEVLDSESFYCDPQKGIRKLIKHFDIRHSPGEIESATAPELFKKDAKCRGLVFDNDSKNELRHETLSLHGKAIKESLNFIRKFIETNKVFQPFTRDDRSSTDNINKLILVIQRSISGLDGN